MAYIQDWGMRVQAQPQINTTRRAFLHLSQNENGRMLNIKITDVNIPSGSTAVLAGTKPDGTVYSQAGTLAGNTATFAEDVQMTAVAGTWDAKITVTNGGNCICTARITITIDPDTVAGGAVPSDSQLDGIIAECRAIADSVRKEAYGSPLVADAVEDMTDQSRVYVYTGSETGYTSGHWYYYNGSAWSDGGVYNAVAVDTDTTLSIAGKAADAKKVGDELASVKEDTTQLKSDLSAKRTGDLKYCPLAYYSNTSGTAIDFKSMPRNTYNWGTYECFKAGFEEANIPNLGWANNDNVAVYKIAGHRVNETLCTVIIRNFTKSQELTLLYFGTSSVNKYRWVLPTSDFTKQYLPADAKAVGDEISALKEDLSDKVDKVTGKGLSTNDYTNEDKQKVTDTASDVSAIKTATDDDIGKALMIKAVADGEVTEWEFGATSSGDISLATPVTKITGWVEGKYFDTSGRATATVDVNNPIDSNDYETVVLPCNYEDYFIINSTGSEGQRSWAFLDENYTIIMNANPSTTYVDEVIQANYGATYLIINKLMVDKDCYKGRTVPDELAEQNKRNDTIDGIFDSLYGINRDPYVNCYNGKYGYGLLNNDGTITKSVKNNVQQNYVTDFLEVEGDTPYAFSYDNNGTRAFAQIPYICQYDSGKRFISMTTNKSTITTSANCKYLRLCVAYGHKSRLDSNFMVGKGTSGTAQIYVPYTNKDRYFGSINNRFYSSWHGEGTVSNSTNLLSNSFGNSSVEHICFGTISIKSEYEISSISLKMSEITLHFDNVVTNEWNKIAGVGYSKQGATKTTFTVQVYYSDGQSHPFSYKEALGFDETAVFGAGNELSADALMKMLTEKSYEHEYFTLMTDLGVSSPIGRMVSARPSKHSETEPFFGFDGENSPIISSEPKSDWSGWNEIGTYGQSQVTQIPIYNRVHGTLETDGMFSAKPLWGAWSENASGSNTHHGGHVFHGWTTDRQHRLTMAVNIYRDDEAAIFNYVPADRAEGAVSGEGKFLRLRLGVDNTSHGVLLDNIYRESGGYYTRMQIHGLLNIKADSREIPTSASSSGVAGDVCFDANYVYFCVADNTWKRIPLQSW